MTTLFFYHLCYSHVWKNNDKPSPVSVGLQLCLLFSVISTHEALFLALYCLPLLYVQNDSFFSNSIHIILPPTLENEHFKKSRLY